jgi:hypothetical protein
MHADAREMNNSGDIEFIAAWDAVKDRDWQAPEGLCRKWLTNLPAGLRVQMPDVIDLLAFGAAMQPDGRTKVDAWGARILSASRLFSAAASGAITIYGQRAELLNNGALGALPLKCLGLYSRIAAQEFANDALTLSPFNPKWLSPAFIARDLALWGKHEAVSHIYVTADRDSLGTLIGKLSGVTFTKISRRISVASTNYRKGRNSSSAVRPCCRPNAKGKRLWPRGTIVDQTA